MAHSSTSSAVAQSGQTTVDSPAAPRRQDLPAESLQHNAPPVIQVTADQQPLDFYASANKQQLHSVEEQMAAPRNSKVVNEADSADERTGLVGDWDDGRHYAATGSGGSSSSRAKGAGQAADGGSVKKRKSAQSQVAATTEDDAKPNSKSVWKSLVDKYGSIELENKGSTARDHLALERTFLAWLRTSLSFASIGIAVTQLFRLNTNIGTIDPSHPAIGHLRRVGKPLGATFIAIAIIILFVGFHRYFESQHYIIRGKFPASRGSVFFVALLAFSLSTASLVVILVLGGSTINT